MTRAHLLDLIAASSATVSEQIEIRRAFFAYVEAEGKREADEREERIRHACEDRRDTLPAPVVKPVTTALEWDLRRSIRDIEKRRAK